MDKYSALAGIMIFFWTYGVTGIEIDTSNSICLLIVGLVVILISCLSLEDYFNDK